MFSYKRALGVVAGAATLAVMAAPSFAAIDKCSKLIDSEALKMSSTASKGFAKCVAAYRKDVIKPPTPALSKAAAACEKENVKIFATLDAEVSKMASQVPKTCTNADLIALGHLPASAFGSRWAQWQAVSALQAAYDQELAANRDFVTILIDTGKTGSCASCTKLSVSPCQTSPCGLAAGSAGDVILASFSVNVPLSGTSTLRVCDVSQLIGSASGVYFVTQNPAKGLLPAAVGSIQTACIKQLAAEGLIQCGAGAQKTSYTTCQDHNTGGVSNISGVTTSGACSGDACQASKANDDANETTAGIINGGACITITNTGGAAGDAFVNLTTQLNLAAVGDNCTNPSTQTIQAPAITALTSGTSQAFVKNADDGGASSEIESIPTTGTPFNCATLPNGSSPGTKLAGAYPSVNGLNVSGNKLDAAIGFSLLCQ